MGKKQKIVKYEYDYSKVHYVVTSDLITPDLSLEERTILAFVASLDRQGLECYASDDYLKGLIDKRVTTTSKVVNGLVKRNYLTKRMEGRKRILRPAGSLEQYLREYQNKVTSAQDVRPSNSESMSESKTLSNSESNSKNEDVTLSNSESQAFNNRGEPFQILKNINKDIDKDYNNLHGQGDNLEYDNINKESGSEPGYSPEWQQFLRNAFAMGMTIRIMAHVRNLCGDSPKIKREDVRRAVECEKNYNPARILECAIMMRDSDKPGDALMKALEDKPQAEPAEDMKAIVSNWITSIETQAKRDFNRSRNV